MVFNEVEMKNKIYVQVNQSSFSPNSAVVTQRDSGWVGPGSNAWSLDKIKIKLNEIHKELVTTAITIVKNQAKKRKLWVIVGHVGELRSGDLDF